MLRASFLRLPSRSGFIGLFFLRYIHTYELFLYHALNSLICTIKDNINIQPLVYARYLEHEKEKSWIFPALQVCNYQPPKIVLHTASKRASACMCVWCRLICIAILTWIVINLLPGTFAVNPWLRSPMCVVQLDPFVLFLRCEVCESYSHTVLSMKSFVGIGKAVPVSG